MIVLNNDYAICSRIMFIPKGAFMNIFDIPQDVLMQELSETICQGENIRIERIISTGQASPDGFWYNQNDDEWVLLLQGEADISFDDGTTTTLKAGEYIFIPAHKKHRVEKTSINPACIWLCVFGIFKI